MTRRKSKFITSVIGSDSSKNKRLTDADTGKSPTEGGWTLQCSSHETRLLTTYNSSPLEKCGMLEETDTALEGLFLNH